MATALKFSVFALVLGIAACSRAPDPEPPVISPPPPVFEGKGT